MHIALYLTKQKRPGRPGRFCLGFFTRIRLVVFSISLLRTADFRTLSIQQSRPFLTIGFNLHILIYRTRLHRISALRTQGSATNVIP